jgi:uncharacterized protein (TIGR02266 family)
MFEVVDMSLSASSELRRETRVPHKMKVNFQCEENFLIEYSSNLSQNGIYLTCKRPLSPGTRLELQFKVEEKSRPHFVSVLGEVIWINNSDKNESGMGIRFINLDEISKEKIQNLIRRIAVL